MNTSQKIDTLLASLHTIAAAPDAADADQFQQSIQDALVDVPEPSKPSGDEADSDLTDAARADADEGRVMLADRRSDPYGFGLPGSVGEGLGGLGQGFGGAGGRRDIADAPQFTDEMGGAPQFCTCISRCGEDSTTASWATNITLHEGHLVGCVQYFVATCFSFMGSYSWF
jgi:hypothetical protein